MCFGQEVEKLKLQRSIDERVLRNTPGEFTEGESTGIGHPGGSVAGNCNVERTGSVIRVNIHVLMRIAPQEHVHAVILEAGDPDVTIVI